MLLLLIALCLPTPTAFAQTPGKEAALHNIGIKTIKAIATSDSTYITSIADPTGIAIGADSKKQTVKSFRSELQNHVGAYCELFERDCKTDHKPIYSLGHVFNSGGDPLNADLKFTVEGRSGRLEYSEPGGMGDLIATLTYRFAGGRWYLCDIHFV